MDKRATVYRMVSEEHLCPFGIKSKDLLARRGFAIDDKRLTSRRAVNAFKRAQGVETTPQIFIGGERIGGYEQLRAYLGLDPIDDGVRYTPVIVIFSFAVLAIVALSLASAQPVLSATTLLQCVALSMVFLAVQKLQDLHSFTNTFVTYDLLARRWVPYGYAYPFLEAYVGLAMLAQWPAWLVAPVALVIGAIGAVSVFKAVYLDRRRLQCACVGGNSQVPLGFISLLENGVMVLMAVYMFALAG